MYSDLKELKVEVVDNVCIATIHGKHPVHVMTPYLFVDLLNFSQAVEQDESIDVIIMRSNNEEFFIAHFDVTALIMQAKDSTNNPVKPATIFHELCERFRKFQSAKDPPTYYPTSNTILLLLLL